MRKIPYFVTPLAVILVGMTGAMAQTEPLPPPEIQATPLPSPEPPPILPAQQETIRQLIEKEIRESGDISDRIDDEVNDTFSWTIDLLNVLITVLIAIPIGTGFVLWWLRQSVIDRLVSNLQKQFQEETEQLVKQQLEAAVTHKLQAQIEEFEREIQQLRTDFEQRLNHLYHDAEKDKANVVQELEHLLTALGQEEHVPASIGRRLQELTDQLESIKTNNGGIAFSAHDYLKEGDAFYLGQRYEEAVASYKAAITINPNLTDAWLGLAKTLRRLGRYPEAIAANEEVIRQEPQNAWGWFGKGYALLDMQQYAAALQAYEVALQSNSSHSTFWKHKGYALAKLHRYPEAIDYLDKALHIRPDSAETYYWKAYCYAAQHQIEMAIEQLQEAIRRRPGLRDRFSTDPDFESIRNTDLAQSLLAMKH